MLKVTYPFEFRYKNVIDSTLLDDNQKIEINRHFIFKNFVLNSQNFCNTHCCPDSSSDRTHFEHTHEEFSMVTSRKSDRDFEMKKAKNSPLKSRPNAPTRLSPCLDYFLLV